jgi:hypothetical protein
MICAPRDKQTSFLLAAWSDPLVIGPNSSTHTTHLTKPAPSSTQEHTAHKKSSTTLRILYTSRRSLASAVRQKFRIMATVRNSVPALSLGAELRSRTFLHRSPGSYQKHVNRSRVVSARSPETGSAPSMCPPSATRALLRPSLNRDTRALRGTLAALLLKPAHHPPCFPDSLPLAANPPLPALPFPDAHSQPCPPRSSCTASRRRTA